MRKIENERKKDMELKLLRVNVTKFSNTFCLYVGFLSLYFWLLHIGKIREKRVIMWTATKIKWNYLDN